MRVVLVAACLALAPAAVGAQTPRADPQAWLAIASSGRLGEARELMLWDAVRNEGDPAGFAEYLRNYPDGTFAWIAKRRIEALRGGVAVAEPAAAPSEGTTAGAIVAVPLPPAAGPGPGAGGDRPKLDLPFIAHLPDGASVAAYDHAFAVLRAAEYDEAAALLRGFVSTYPGDPLTANATYWLGEIYMVHGDYARAASSFDDVLRAQPDGPKTEDALFKLATALGRGGQERQACDAFARLGREHPAAAARYGVTLTAERRRLGC